MSEDTYYTVLEIPESATQAEIKTAYRDLIKQVHPDTLANLSPYLRGIAESRAKDIIEAYSVLSNATKRREYDRQIAELRQQNAPHTPPQQNAPPAPPPRTAPQPPPGAYPGGSSAPPPTPNTPPQPAPGTYPGGLRYHWGLLKWIWTSSRPVFVAGLSVLALYALGVAAILVGAAVSDPPKPTPSNAALAAPQRPSATPVAMAAETNPASALVPIAGVYSGTVHNKTADVTASFAVLFEQGGDATLTGCTEIKRPLYGSGLLKGTIRGPHVEFAVNKIRFQGEASDNAISGSYIASTASGQELGEFNIARQAAAHPEYGCANGILARVEKGSKLTPVVAPAEHGETVRPKPVVPYATAAVGYATLEKRCSFMEQGKCFDGTMARLRIGDRLKILSPEVRAENGHDIRRVRTEQGWEGWVDCAEIRVQTP